MKGSPGYRFSKEELDWVAANLDDMQAWARGDRIWSWTLVGTAIAGLAVHVLGFALASEALALPGGWPSELIADLLANLGIALWTSVIIVLFVDALPAWNRRRAQSWARRALAALQERGDAVAQLIPDDADADAVGAKLDAILARLGAIESAVGPHRDGAA